MQSPLRDDFGYLGDTDKAQQVLRGEYTSPAELDEGTRAFLAALPRNKPAGPTVTASITRDDYQAYWKKALERTSSSFSGLHFGHWKAAAKNDFLSETHAVFTELAYSSGFSLPRWQTGLSAMLEKERGVIKADKLRAILLMEADFNFANKLVFGHRMMRQAERKQQIPKEIYGSRNGHSATELGLNRRLVTDLSRQRRWPMAISSVDAHTCYDRIAHAVASICCQRWDVDLGPILAMLITIQQMKFFLRTAFGDSESFYSSGNGIPFQGICQGNGAGPAVWLAVSVVLVLMLHAQGHVSTIRSAFSSTVIVFCGFLFVDDTDLIVFAPDDKESADEIVRRMQASVLAWQGGLRATGGALKPPKCSWSLAAFHFPNGKWSYHTATTLPARLDVPGPDGSMVEIQRHDPSTAIKVVGLMQALDGSMDGQLKVLKERADDWGDKIRDGYLPRKLAWAGLHTTIWSSLKYPLPTTNFSQAQGKAIMLKFYKHVLPKLGVCRNFPNAYRHAPYSLQGLALPAPYIEQGIEHIKMTLTHGSIPTMTGHFIVQSLQQLQLEAGIGTPVLEASFSRFGYYTTVNCWIRCQWEFLSKQGIQMKGGLSHVPGLQRQNDRYLMEIVDGLSGVTASETSSFNRCRVHYQALTLADICTGDGKRIRAQALRCTRDPQHLSRWIWGVEQPSTDDIKVWEKLLKQLCLASLYLPRADRLGEWISVPQCKDWQWWYHPTSQRLYRRQPDGRFWMEYCNPTGRSIRAGSNFRLTAVSANRPPVDCLRATATLAPGGTVIFEGAADAILPPVPTPGPTTISEAVHSLEAGWPLRDSIFPLEGLQIAIAIITGRAQGVCDGSYMPNLSLSLASAAWIIEDPEAPGPACRGACRVSGQPSDTNAYRAELQGIHALLLAATVVCRAHRIGSGALTVGCDCEKGVDLSRPDWLKVNLKCKHVDLVRAIRRLKEALPIKVHFRHIAGHQDRKFSMQQLSRREQLNVIMDDSAKRYLIRLIEQQPPLGPSSIEGEGWSCWIKGKKLTSDPALPVRQHVFSNDLKTYLHNKKKLDKECFDFVDWDANSDAFAGFPQLFKLWATKHVSGCCGVNSMMFRWGRVESPLCPCCGTVNETTEHLLFCEAPKMVERWEASVEGFAAWLTSTDTHPLIEACFLDAVRARSLSEPRPWTLIDDRSIQQAIQVQNNIGWINFMEGKVACEWKALQEQHYRSRGSRRTGRRWAAGLVTNLLELCHSQWTTRNTHVHPVAANGLPLEEAQALVADIQEEFALGTEGLAAEDRHYLETTVDEVLRSPVGTQLAWRQGIQNARLAYERRSTASMDQMRATMAAWLAAPD
jgi:hypothetical protein